MNDLAGCLVLHPIFSQVLRPVWLQVDSDCSLFYHLARFQRNFAITVQIDPQF